MADLFGFYSLIEVSPAVEAAWTRLVAACSPSDSEGGLASAPIDAAIQTGASAWTASDGTLQSDGSGRARFFVTGAESSRWVDGAKVENGRTAVALLGRVQQPERRPAASMSDRESEFNRLAQLARAGSAVAVGPLGGAWLSVVHDFSSDSLICLRSCDGAPPLYYYLNDSVLWFGSRLATLRRMPPFPAGVDYSAVSHLLGFGFPPRDRTLFRNVKRLRAGGRLRSDSSGVDEGNWDDAARGVFLGATPGGQLDTSDSLIDAVVEALGERVSGRRTAVLGPEDDPWTAWLEQAVARVGGLQAKRIPEGLLTNPETALATWQHAIATEGEIFAWPALVDLIQQAEHWSGAADVCISATGASLLSPGAPHHQRFGERLASSGGRARRGLGEPRFLQMNLQLVRDLYFEQIAFLDDAARFALGGPMLAQWNIFSMADELGSALESATVENASTLAFEADNLLLVSSCLRPLVDAAGSAAGVPMIAPLLAQPVRANGRAISPKGHTVSAKAPVYGGAPEAPGFALMETFVAANEAAVRELLTSQSFLARGLFSRAAVTTLLDHHFRGIARRAPVLWVMCGLEMWFRNFVDYRR